MISLLSPKGKDITYHTLSETTQHDLALDLMVTKLSEMPQEQNIIRRFMSQMTADPETAKYRSDIFADIMAFPKLRSQMMELLDKVSFLKEYGSFKRDFDKAGMWDLMHRLDEIRDYITIVEAIHDCLTDTDIKSQGLLNLRDYANAQYYDSGFEELKKDIANIKTSTNAMKSLTVGINLNDRFEAESVGLISVNGKAFTKSSFISNFTGFLTSKDGIQPDTEWKEDYHYQQVTQEDVSLIGTGGMIERVAMYMQHPMLSVGIYKLSRTDNAVEVPHYMDRILNHMLSSLAKKLRELVSKHVAVSITEMALLIPEFTYYIRWAEYVEKLQARGVHFCKPEVLGLSEKSSDLSEKSTMQAEGIFNLKLADAIDYKDIVTNDLDFSDEHQIYILTGANRGGKTTITQAVGMCFLLAQGGIYVPGERFRYAPADRIFTHFPADEDKTMDFGRLGEECQRFRDIYQECTKDSLLLLNETFSTTSFEEGYYIAYDAVRALLQKGPRTIYNTHMHKLGYEVDQINQSAGKGRAASLVMTSAGGQRSYKVKVAEPEGTSYAKDIAEKYGVTYDQLTGC